MKIGQQVSAQRNVVAADRVVLAAQMVAQHADLRGRGDDREFADERSFHEAPRGERGADLVIAGLDDEPAFLGPHADDAMRGQLGERLAYDSPAHAEYGAEIFLR